MIAKVTYANMLTSQHALIKLRNELCIAFEITAVSLQIIATRDGCTTVIPRLLVNREEGLIPAEKDWFAAVPDVKVEELFPASTEGRLHNHMHVFKVRVSAQEQFSPTAPDLLKSTSQLGLIDDESGWVFNNFREESSEGGDRVHFFIVKMRVLTHHALDDVLSELEVSLACNDTLVNQVKSVRNDWRFATIKEGHESPVGALYRIHLIPRCRVV